MKFNDRNFKIENIIHARRIKIMRDVTEALVKIWENTLVSHNINGITLREFRVYKNDIILATKAISSLTGDFYPDHLILDILIDIVESHNNNIWKMKHCGSFILITLEGDINGKERFV